MIVASTTSDSVPQQPSNQDEFFMQQSLLFSETLKDLKNLRKQLYSAAECFEVAYRTEEQKEVLAETVKDYVIKAFVNTVDHLGYVTYKVSCFSDKKTSEISGLELRLSCLKQRLQTCQEFIRKGCLSQQSRLIETPKHHKRYIFPVEENCTSARPKCHSFSLCSRFEPHEIQNASCLEIQVTATKATSPCPREELLILVSPQPSFRQVTCLFSSVSRNQNPGNRAMSPRRFPLLCSGSLRQITAPRNYSSPRRQRYPSQPRRTVSLSTAGDRERAKDTDEYAGKSKRMFKAMLSLRKSKRDVSL